MVFGRELLVVHEVLSESEAKKVSAEYSTPIDKFPKILQSDPQAIKIGAKAGQLIKIHREDPTGKYSAYRYVVESV